MKRLYKHWIIGFSIYLLIFFVFILILNYYMPMEWDSSTWFLQILLWIVLAVVYGLTLLIGIGLMDGDDDDD